MMLVPTADPVQIVDLWRVYLRSPPRPCAMGGCLSEAERRRVRGFHDEDAMRRFVSSRDALRHIVGERFRIDPRAVTITHRPDGKLVVVSTSEARVAVNLSHTNGVALIAVSDGSAVGVDVERIRHGVDVDRIATRFFSPDEARGLAAVSARRKPYAFFRLWVRKEALTKAAGDGFRARHDFELSRVSDETGSHVIRTSRRGTWILRDVRVNASTIGAVAVRGEGGFELRSRAWA